MDSTSENTGGALNSPFLLDMERLRAIASDRIIRRGIAYFKENRVVQLDWDDHRIWAMVEGSTPNEPYLVELSLDGDGEICVDCECPFDWEPVCKHAVAALLAFGAQQPVQQMSVENAAEQAIEDRMKRGRSEVVVEAVAAEFGYGTWTASTLRPYRPSAQTYRVQLRHLSERVNHCNCPDFNGNRLGTCKHIEAVLNRIRKDFGGKKAALLEAHPPPPFFHLAWDAPDTPSVRLMGRERLSARTKASIAPLVDADGYLIGELPRAYHRLLDALDADNSVQIGDDVIDHTRRIAEDQAHGVRGEQIKRRVLSAGNRLANIQARLYPYQVEGVAFLAANGRAILADDMGLGKTLQAIAATAWLMEHAEVRRTLVVCPASLKHQWAREIERFTGTPTAVIQGPVSAREVQYRAQTPFTIVNYELVLRDHSVINETFAPDLLILDEAQRIKNWRTKTADTIKSVTSTFAFILTGTPLENRLEDLYSLMQVVDRRVLGPLWRFMIDFHVMDERGKIIGYRNLCELRRRLKPVMLRRDRRLVRDQLPDRIEHRLDVELDAKQRELHDDALAAAALIARILKKRPLTPSEEMRMLGALQNARMACDAAGLVDKETRGSPKLDELGRLLEEICADSDRKVIVFSAWERMTEMAENVAKRLGLGTVRLHGGVPTAKRGGLLDRFRDDPAVQVFLSTDAGGVGLNLQHADVLINVDMPWNPAVLEQRIGRVHRLGQRHKVQIILLLSANSYEERVAELVATKKDLFDNVVREEATEDVVGLSKRALEWLAESLETEERENDRPGDEKPKPDSDIDVPRNVGEGDAEPREKPDDDTVVNATLAQLQAALGTRIERVLAVGGGLLAVVDHVDETAEKAATEASNGISVEVIDARTQAALERLSAASPLANAQPVFVAEPKQAPPPLLAMARRKVAAANLLVQGECVTDAMELLTAAMFAAVAHRGGVTNSPQPSEAAVWLHTEAAPRGWVNTDETAAISRALALAQSPSLPKELAQQVIMDAERLITTTLD